MAAKKKCGAWTCDPFTGCTPGIDPASSAYAEAYAEGRVPASSGYPRNPNCFQWVRISSSSATSILATGVTGSLSPSGGPMKPIAVVNSSASNASAAITISDVKIGGQPVDQEFQLGQGSTGITLPGNGREWLIPEMTSERLRSGVRLFPTTAGFATTNKPVTFTLTDTAGDGDGDADFYLAFRPPSAEELMASLVDAAE